MSKLPIDIPTGSTAFSQADRASSQPRPRARKAAGPVPISVAPSGVFVEKDNEEGGVVVNVVSGGDSSEPSEPLTETEILKSLKSGNTVSDEDKVEQQDRLDDIQIFFSIVFDLLVWACSKRLQLPLFDKFHTLQHQIPGTDLYHIGRDDFCFVVTVIVNLIFIRAFLMKCVLGPFARRMGISHYKPLQRFKEQGWSLLYYLFSWLFGFYLYWNSDYWFSADALYAGWPHDRLSHSFKFYYLLQTGCWLQQMIVLNIEEKRKDHLQMFSHHIITLCLVLGSYYFYFTRVGHVILLLMDIVDVFLSGAKMLKYCGFTRICDALFIFFMVSWIVLRHGFYNYVWWHACTKATDIMDRNCSTTAPGEMCYTQPQINVFLGLVGGLQVLMIIWLGMILRVAWRVVRGGDADDVRSDDGSD